MTTLAEAGAESVLTFWFGDVDARGLMDRERRQALFRADPAFDAHIRERFATDVDAALAGDRDHWATTARGRVALILLLDQFTRNIHRGDARAYAGDEQALQFARVGVENGDHRLLGVDMRVFSYLPFEHAENMADQDTCVALLEALAAEHAEGTPAAAVIQEYLRHALEHREIVARFGRFPHRNGVLGRSDTEAEAAWRKRDRRSFGQ